MTVEHFFITVAIALGLVALLVVATIIGGVLGLIIPALFVGEEQAVDWLKASERNEIKVPAIPHWRCMACGMMIHADYAKLGVPVVCGRPGRASACPMEYVDENGNDLQ